MYTYFYSCQLFFFFFFFFYQKTFCSDHFRQIRLAIAYSYYWWYGYVLGKTSMRIHAA